LSYFNIYLALLLSIVLSAPTSLQAWGGSGGDKHGNQVYRDCFGVPGTSCARYNWVERSGGAQNPTLSSNRQPDPHNNKYTGRKSQPSVQRQGKSFDLCNINHMIKMTEALITPQTMYRLALAKDYGESFRPIQDKIAAAIKKNPKEVIGNPKAVPLNPATDVAHVMADTMGGGIEALAMKRRVHDASKLMVKFGGSDNTEYLGKMLSDYMDSPLLAKKIVKTFQGPEREQKLRSLFEKLHKRNPPVMAGNHEKYWNGRFEDFKKNPSAFMGDEINDLLRDGEWGANHIDTSTFVHRGYNPLE
jgi:hypothetical protein